MGQFDIENGWSLDERNWAVLTAAENVVETAEQVIILYLSALGSMCLLTFSGIDWCKDQ